MSNVTTRTPAPEFVGFSVSTARRRVKAFNAAALKVAREAELLLEATKTKPSKKTPAKLVSEVLEKVKPARGLKKQQVLDCITRGATVKSMCDDLHLGETAIRSLVGDLRAAGITIACDRKHEKGPYYTLA